MDSILLKEAVERVFNELTNNQASPYQQDIIDTTMADFDAQAQLRYQQGIWQLAAQSGNLGGGREAALSDPNINPH